MAWPTKPGVKVEVVVFNGKKYRRYPDSPRKHLSRYFSRSGGFLHRDIWEFYNGKIPDGCQIHHRDENHLNNDPKNLECITKEAHAAHRHKAQVEHNKSDAQLEHLARIRGKAAEWHRSPEGVEWHKQHGKRSWVGRVPTALVCEECGGKFESVISTARFCGPSCGNKRWRKDNPGYDALKRARRKAASLQSGG